MNKIKLGHVINDAVGRGGVSTIVYHFLKELPEEKYERYLYSLKPEPDGDNIPESHRNRFQTIGVPLSFANQETLKVDGVRDLCKWILRNKIDILHTHSYRPNQMGRLAGVLCRNVKIVAHYHNYYDNKWEQEDSLLFDQLLAPYSNQLIASSEAVKSHISEKIEVRPETIEVVLNGVDLTQFEAGHHDPIKIKKELRLPTTCTVVGIIGRISEQKAQDDFIKAAQLIKASVPNTMFLVVGGGGDKKLMDRLRCLMVSLGLEKDVLFTGHIHDITKVYAVLDILVVPSRWEGFGLILVEGMAFGKPIVSTNVGPIPEVVVADETALLAPPSNPPAIASKVIHLLKNPGEAKKMGEKGRKRAEKFSWKRSALQLETIYHRLMKNP